MKKSLFVLGMAVAAFASCTNEEVMEVAENRAIRFDAFVNNTTRAVTEINASDGLSSFYVFGYFGADESNGPWDGIAFNNESNSAQRYWQVGNYYRFGAYADGKAGEKIETASYNPITQTLTISDYTPKDANDLVVATGTGDASTTPTDAVPLTFKHMLSQVKLTFTTDAAATYKIAITDVSFTALHKSTGTYTSTGTIKWTDMDDSQAPGEDALYTYEEFKGTDKLIGYGTPASQSKLVIPQEGTNAITVKFTATITDENADYTQKTNTFTATLGHNLNSDGQAANTWLPGYRYNYTANVTVEDITEEEDLTPIEFEASVEDWKDASEDDITTTPTAVEPEP